MLEFLEVRFLKRGRAAAETASGGTATSMGGRGIYERSLSDNRRIFVGEPRVQNALLMECRKISD